MRVFRKLYIDAKFYADYEYAIYFISKINFTKVITFLNTPQMYRYTRTFWYRDKKYRKNMSFLKRARAIKNLNIKSSYPLTTHVLIKQVP